VAECLIPWVQSLVPQNKKSDISYSSNKTVNPAVWWPEEERADTWDVTQGSWGSPYILVSSPVAGCKVQWQWHFGNSCFWCHVRKSSRGKLLVWLDFSHFLNFSLSMCWNFGEKQWKCLWIQLWETFTCLPTFLKCGPLSWSMVHYGRQPNRDRWEGENDLEGKELKECHPCLHWHIFLIHQSPWHF
jgi:hypothetical protein